jgi:hypothetical protein
MRTEKHDPSDVHTSLGLVDILALLTLGTALVSTGALLVLVLSSLS